MTFLGKDSLSALIENGFDAVSQSVITEIRDSKDALCGVEVVQSQNLDLGQVSDTNCGEESGGQNQSSYVSQSLIGQNEYGPLGGKFQKDYEQSDYIQDTVKIREFRARSKGCSRNSAGSGYARNYRSLAGTNGYFSHILESLNMTDPPGHVTSTDPSACSKGICSAHRIANAIG